MHTICSFNERKTPESPSPLPGGKSIKRKGVGWLISRRLSRVHHVHLLVLSKLRTPTRTSLQCLSRQVHVP
eukprot:jgi/Botrbrau1/20795/Bobra.0156s0025.1